MPRSTTERHMPAACAKIHAAAPLRHPRTCARPSLKIARNSASVVWLALAHSGGIRICTRASTSSSPRRAAWPTPAAARRRDTRVLRRLRSAQAFHRRGSEKRRAFNHQDEIPRISLPTAHRSPKSTTALARRTWPESGRTGCSGRESPRPRSQRAPPSQPSAIWLSGFTCGRVHHLSGVRCNEVVCEL